MIPQEALWGMLGMGLGLGTALLTLAILVLWEVYGEVRLRHGVLMVENLVRAAEQMGHQRLWTGTEKREYVLQAVAAYDLPLSPQAAEVLLESAVLKLKPSQRRSSKPPLEAYESAK